MDAPNSLVLAIIGVTMMLAGYFLYSQFLAKKVYKLNAEFKTPAHQFTDGVDFLPTNRYILWGHHFTSVAGAAPIVGPAIAVIWGWLPAFIWVTIGTVFMAGMHDFGALWASTRNKGKSMGALSGTYIGNRGRNLFLVVILLLLLMVLAAFAVVISGLLVAQPGAVIPTWGALVVAVLVGQAIYRFKWNLLAVTAVGVVLLYALILLGDAYPVSLPEEGLFGLTPQAIWIVLLFVYSGIASMLPVWVLLQPRDFINGIQLFIGLGIIYGAVLLATPTVVAPAVNDALPDDTPPLVPLLFVTIACGAISGFHGIVSSGTSSKQLDRETDARFVGYFGAVGEGLLALGAIIATTAGFQTATQWREFYDSFSSGGVPVFVEGGASIINEGLAIPTGLSATILATMVILFAATTLDTGTRLMRFVVQEVGEIAGVKIKTGIATLIVVVLAFGLTFSQGADATGGMALWPLFGTTNQLLAGLTLTILTIILIRKGRPFLPVLLPAAFVLFMTIYAAIVQLVDLYNAGDWLLLVIDIIIIVAAAWVLVEAIIAMLAARKAPKEPEDDVALTEDQKLPRSA
ncbi:carbon starvation CstA family protein [Nesterenkonia natronophila]|uniref:Carbon starvation protein A n=1 Tax=Nesterenkonia natronophila TaxID=2174932 RepID=A0A3A4G320_9MICC|nr:carbon starvation protein A [Nesterenkonia natronophila]RJN32619.1 carbon starvation protein A [Nesterenkonia natronophila]